MVVVVFSLVPYRTAQAGQAVVYVSRVRDSSQCAAILPAGGESALETKGSRKRSVVEEVRLKIYYLTTQRLRTKQKENRYLDEERGGRVKRREGSQSRAGQQVWVFEFASGKILMMTNWAAVAVASRLCTAGSSTFSRMLSMRAIGSEQCQWNNPSSIKERCGCYLVRLWAKTYKYHQLQHNRRTRKEAID